MLNWLSTNAMDVVGLLVGSFIAYHVYFLSRRLDFKDKLVHKDNIRKKVETLLINISKGINREVELVNVEKYYSHYPDNNDKNRRGHTYLKAELKSLRYDGVEFFCESPRAVYIKSDGKLTFNEKDGINKADFNVFPVGLVPYEWIEYVDVRGDEFGYHPQFFTRFNSCDKYPYKYIVHYTLSDTFKKGEPPDTEFRKVYVENNRFLELVRRCISRLNSDL